MIALRKINGHEFILNADLIESIESTPDTIITLTSGKKIIVQNTIEDVVRKAVKYKQLTYQALRIVPGGSTEAERKDPGTGRNG